MTDSTTIDERLELRAGTADAATAKKLRAAAKRTTSWTHLPQNRKQADRAGALLSPEVTPVLGEELVDLLAQGIRNPSDFAVTTMVGASYALAGLLVAAQDIDAADSVGAAPALQSLLELVPLLDPDTAEWIHFVSGQFEAEVRADALHAAAASRLHQEPETEIEQWADGLGLDLPFARWSLQLFLPGSAPGIAHDSAVTFGVYFKSAPRCPGPFDWQVNLGLVNRDQLGVAEPGHRPISGSPVSYDRGAGIAGAVTSPSTIDEIPALVAALEQAHPDLVFDRSKLKIDASRGLLSAAAKASLKNWL